jgi:glycosyltransferase involved in cell wall biosynthesis
MKRVMIVTNSLAGGGAERSMNLVCNELVKRGWPISLVPINSGTSDQVIPMCEVFPLERKWHGTFMNMVVTLWKFNSLVNSWRPDVIVLNCDLPELFGAILFGKHNLVVMEHTSKPWGQRVLLGKIVRRNLKLRKTTWAAVSNHLTIWPSGEKPTAVLQNPVLLPKENETLVTDNDIKRLIFIGRLSHEKRPELALEIAKLTNLKLIIIGDGLMKEELEKKANLESIKATFLGWIENPWLKIRSGDLLIVTSSFEGDGLIVIEGMQKGIPILLSDILDFRRFGLPERNYCQTVEDFIARINEYHEDLYLMTLPENIVSPILVSRSLEVVGDSWEEFLNSI